MATYLRPTSLDDALDAMTRRPLVPIAGGTDHYPSRAVRQPDEDVIDLSALPGLRAIGREDGTWRIPALATWTDIADTPLPPLFDGLKSAARQVGGRQIQNAGTLVGNVCNASPAADGIPPLLTMDAAVELRSAAGVRTVPLASFVLGNRRTARAPEELVTALLVPHRAAVSAFSKLGARAYLVISITMVATVLELDGAGIVRHAAVAVGACGPTALRLPALEADLVGHAPGTVPVWPEHLAALTPIDDVRAPAAYRRDATLEVLRRVLAGFAPVLERAA